MYLKFGSMRITVCVGWICNTLCATIAKVIKAHISNFGTKAKCQTSKHSNSIFIILFQYRELFDFLSLSLSLPRTTTTEEKLQGENLKKAVSKISVLSLAAFGFFNYTLGLYYYFGFSFSVLKTPPLKV